MLGVRFEIVSVYIQGKILLLRGAGRYSTSFFVFIAHVFLANM